MIVILHHYVLDNALNYHVGYLIQKRSPNEIFIKIHNTRQDHIKFDVPKVYQPRDYLTRFVFVNTFLLIWVIIGCRINSDKGPHKSNEGNLIELEYNMINFWPYQFMITVSRHFANIFKI